MPLPINKADFLEGKLTTRWPSGNDLKVKFNFKILQRVKSVQVVRAVSFITRGFIWELVNYEQDVANVCRLRVTKSTKFALSHINTRVH